MKKETIKEAQDVVLCTFLVDSHPAIVLFDTGASLSFKQMCLSGVHLRQLVKSEVS